jgi:T3SS negative regulator,GrlR
MPQIEALYVVEFGDFATGGRTMENGGVAVLETNRVLGGDSGYYYVGTYTFKDGRIEATVKIVKHNLAWRNAFGDAATSFTVKIQGMISNGIMNGQMERTDRPGLRLPIRLTWKEDLP